MRIFRVRSAVSREALHSALDRLDAVAVRRGAVGSLEEAELAEHLARAAFERKTNISRQLRYEFLLWLSGKTDIKSAMAETKPDGDEFFVVLFSDAVPDGEVRGDMEAKLLPLALKRRAEPLALERISLSRAMK